MQSFKCRPRNQARAVVHTRFSLDVEPIDAFQSLVEALSVVSATPIAETPEKPVQTPSAVVLRDVYEAEVDRLRAKLAVVPAPELNHRQKSALAHIQTKAEPEQAAHQAQELARAMGEEVDASQIADFYVRPEKPWRAPSEKTVRKARPSHGGPRQETTVRRFKRFGIKN